MDSLHFCSTTQQSNEQGKEILKSMKKLEKYIWFKIITLLNTRLCVGHVVWQLCTTVSAHTASIYCRMSGQKVPKKHCYLCTTLHYVMSENGVIFCFSFTLLNFGSQINILGTQPRLWARQSSAQFQQSMVTFLFSKMSRPALGLTQPPAPWIKGALPLGLNSQSIQ